MSPGPQSKAVGIEQRSTPYVTRNSLRIPTTTTLPPLRARRQAGDARYILRKNTLLRGNPPLLTNPYKGQPHCVHSPAQAAAANQSTATLETDGASSSAPPQPTPPPNKTHKRSRHDIPRDQSHPERESPQKRYLGKRCEVPPAPPHFSLVASTYEDDSPMEDLTFFDLAVPNPLQPPSVDASAIAAAYALSPPVSTPSLSSTAQSTPPSPSPSVHSLSAPPSRTATPCPDDDEIMIDVIVEAAFKAPMRNEFIAATPKSRDDNPHHPAAAHDPGNGQAITQYTGFQANDPGWGNPILADHVLLEHMSDDTQKEVRENPGNFLAATPFSAGNVLFAKYKNVRSDSVGVLEEVARKGNVKLIMPQPKAAPKAAPRPARRGPAGKHDKFAGLICMLIRCSDAQIRHELTTQATFTSNRLLALHVTAFDAAWLSWAIGFFKTDIDDPPNVTGNRLCWAVYEMLTKGSPVLKAVSLINRATQGGSTLSRDQRFLDFANTFDVRHLPHDDNPVYVLYAKPCTKDPKLWDDIHAALRIMYTDMLEAFVLHANAASGHNLCADCKLDCHPKYNCIFTVRDRGFWGPRGLDSILKTLNSGNLDSEGDVRGEPRPRTSNTPFMCGRETAMGRSGIVGGGSSATGARPTDEDARSGGEMAHAHPSGSADASPGAVRLQGGTSTCAVPIQRHGSIQRPQHRPSHDEDPASGDYQRHAEGGVRAPEDSEIHGDANTLHAPVERAPTPPIDWDAFYDSIPPRTLSPPADDDDGPQHARPPPNEEDEWPMHHDDHQDGDNHQDDGLPFANGIPLDRPPTPLDRTRTFLGPPRRRAEGGRRKKLTKASIQLCALNIRRIGNPNPWHPKHKWYHVNQLSKNINQE
ncbi:hypothetical protein B0H17DRAFT_1137297 [Mycena rosella]|uniref:Uncharacterized protein n=1 Tax=Mycena rosella TaxID=1033263 RepID=A0AAD7D9H0_MYCRO|nr:hypothetical protein B0H17DRAFT_1137297 [Mycena rosella]